MATRPAPVVRKAGQVATGTPLFDGLRCFIASCVPISEHTGMMALLVANGAIEVKSAKEADFIFTDSETFEAQTRCRKLLLLYYRNGLTAVLRTRLGKTTHARGGMYREGLTRDVTHLIVLSPTGDKYCTARRHAAQTGIKIVLVHWFDDCFKVEHRLPERPYEEALLKLEREMRQQTNGEEILQSVAPTKRKKMKLPERAKSFYDALNMASTPPQANSNMRNSIGSAKPHINVWHGRRILLSHSLILSKDRRTTVVTEIERCGGVVVTVDLKKPTALIASSQAEHESYDVNVDEFEELDSDAELEEDLQFEVDFTKWEEKRSKEDALKLSARYRAADLREAMLVMEGGVDVLVTKYRSGLAYLAALHGGGEGRKEVAVGTLPWIFYVQELRAFSAPTSQLLHFPVRRGAAQNLKGKTITISNYQGPARDYLKKLISVMGGPRAAGAPEIFTATLSKQTSVVIASRLEGKKVESAQAWRIPVVNHLWLEDTFKTWREASLADQRYTHWRSKISFGDLLPGCPVIEGSISELKEDADDVVKEMKAIGYDEKLIQAALAGNLDALRDAEMAPRQQVTVDADPTSSYAEVERSLHVDDTHMDVDEEEIIPKTSSPKKVGPSSDKPPSDAGAHKTFKPPSGKRLVPVIMRPPRDSSTCEAIANAIAERYVPKEVVSSSSHSKQPTVEPTSQPGLQVPITVAAAAGPTLRSPWDPSPTKKPILSRVVNDSPAEFRRSAKKKQGNAKEETVRQPAKPPAAVAEQSDVSMEDAEITIKAGGKGKSKAQDKESQSEDDAPAGRRQGAKSKSKPQSAGRGKKRNIQTQESDEEFKVETQDDLISRRRKVVNADVEMSPNNKATASRSRRSLRQEAREDSSSSEEEYKHGEKGKKGVSKKADKAIRRLRDSISGKEGADPSKEGGTKGATHGPTAPSDNEDSPNEHSVEVERKPKKAKGPNKPKAALKITDTSSLTPAPTDNEDPTSPSTSVLSKRTSSASKSAASSEDEESNAPRARRGAATKATQLLRDKVMPDANLFAQQMKKGDVRNDWEGDKKRRRDSAMEDTDNTADTKRRRKIGEGVVVVKKKRDGSAVPNSGIRMLTTKVPLRDEELQKLHKMGIQRVEDPLTCTHLVSNTILRTEKFLCAISGSPIIVTEAWVRECLRSKTVVDTEPYLLQDIDGERKFNFDLETCLERARENGKTLLRGHFFYLIFTSEIADNVIRTLSSAIKSAGGTCARQVPSLRQVEDHQDTRHVVSDLNGKSKWSPLSQKGIAIYNQEVILTAILQQELPDWTNPEFLLS